MATVRGGLEVLLFDDGLLDQCLGFVRGLGKHRLLTIVDRFDLLGGWSSGDDTSHIGPDTSLGHVVPKGTTWARFNEHTFTVTHGESLVSDGQWNGTIDATAWTRLNLLSAESVGEFVLVNADVGESSAGTE